MSDSSRDRPPSLSISESSCDVTPPPDSDPESPVWTRIKEMDEKLREAQLFHVQSQAWAQSKAQAAACRRAGDTLVDKFVQVLRKKRVLKEELELKQQKLRHLTENLNHKKMIINFRNESNAHARQSYEFWTDMVKRQGGNSERQSKHAQTMAEEEQQLIREHTQLVTQLTLLDQEINQTNKQHEQDKADIMGQIEMMEQVAQRDMQEMKAQLDTYQVSLLNYRDAELDNLKQQLAQYKSAISQVSCQQRDLTQAIDQMASMRDQGIVDTQWIVVWQKMSHDMGL